jgi:hypothetical protein
MTEQRTTVDVLSLEEFQGTLKARLSEINAVLSKLNGAASATPRLGTFADAAICAEAYAARHAQYVARAQQLKDALQAAYDATETIITNYRTAESRNQANAYDIADVLGGVDKALKGSGRADV